MPCAACATREPVANRCRSRTLEARRWRPTTLPAFLPTIRVCTDGKGAPVKRSTDRVLTTHAGSLPRPDDVLAMVGARARGGFVDQSASRARLRDAVADIVRTQLRLGIDVVDDGELSKPGFIHYVNERLAGFEPSPEAPAR